MNKCGTTLTTKWSEHLSTSKVQKSKIVFCPKCLLVSCFLSRYLLNNHKDISSQIANTMPKFSFEVRQLLWLLFKMAKKLLGKFDFCLCAPSSLFSSSKWWPFCLPDNPGAIPNENTRSKTPSRHICLVLRPFFPTFFFHRISSAQCSSGESVLPKSFYPKEILQN